MRRFKNNIPSSKSNILPTKKYEKLKPENFLYEIDASRDTDDTSSEHRSSFRKSSMGSEADLNAEPSKYSKPSFDFKALHDDGSQSRKGTDVSDVEVIVN